MPPSLPPLLQIFNRYLVAGGEEFATREYAQLLAQECRFGECIFDSADWRRPGAPPIWKQAALTFYNPHSVRRLREKQNEVQARAWIVHNVLPVGSPGIYAEALRQKIPIIQSINNFRPFSVTGYLWIGRQLDTTCWPRNYLQEIACGAWQNSRLKTAFLAVVLASMHLRNQFRAVKSWIAITDFMRDQFIAAGLPAERVFRLYYPWSIRNAAPDFPRGDYYLFLGRLIEEKGIKVLINAWDVLVHQLGVRAPRLIIAGEGPLADFVKAAQGGNSRLEFRGFVSGAEKDRLLAGCRAVIQPAIWAEPLSLVIYEAFDYGKPVLVAASGGMPELVQSGGGLIHRAGDVRQLVSQVLELEGSAPGTWRAMGEAGRRWLLSHTNPRTWKNQLFEIVQYALQNND